MLIGQLLSAYNWPTLKPNRCGGPFNSKQQFSILSRYPPIISRKLQQSNDLVYSTKFMIEMDCLKIYSHVNSTVRPMGYFVMAWPWFVYVCMHINEEHIRILLMDNVVYRHHSQCKNDEVLSFIFNFVIDNVDDINE